MIWSQMAWTEIQKLSFNKKALRFNIIPSPLILHQGRFFYKSTLIVTQVISDIRFRYKLHKQALVLLTSFKR